VFKFLVSFLHQHNNIVTKISSSSFLAHKSTTGDDRPIYKPNRVVASVNYKLITSGVYQ